MVELVLQILEAWLFSSHCLAWVVKSIIFNPSLVLKRSSQAHSDVHWAPAGTLQWYILPAQ